MRIWLKTPSAKRRMCASAYLRTHLGGHGHDVIRSRQAPAQYDAVVSFGQRHSERHKPVINGECSRFNKSTHLKMFNDAGISAPVVHVDVDAYEEGTMTLARKLSHRKGLDIIECRTKQQLVEAMRQRDFWVKWIPTKVEYRVWVFRDKVFAVYEKQFKGDGPYQGVARNRRFGFKFVSREMDGVKHMDALRELCVKAVKTIHLDWGAVDVIRGKDGKFYVLEVNTMPNIDSLERKSGRELARLISEAL